MAAAEEHGGRPAHNLPGELSEFVGREVDLVEVAGLVHRERLVTITGPGGSGKTRLARQVAQGQVARLSDGVWWVDLADVRDAESVVDAVARAVGLIGEPVGDAGTLLAERLRSRELLLVLDNCEHLVEAVAGLVERILRAAPDVRVLATSRESLAVAGEVAWRIDALPGADGVRLFVERASRARSSFALSEAEHAAVAAICERLDGMPLAIELAAARCRSLAPAEILARLDDVFGLLRDQRRSAQARQQTLDASVEWSHSLLEPEEQVLLRRLSVFAGGCSADDAVGVTTDSSLPEDHLYDALDRLVAQSMVVLDDSRARSRYRLLETVRQYAARRLAEAGERDEQRRRHAQWFLELARREGPGLEGPGDVDTLARLSPEVANLRLAGETLDEQGRYVEHAELVAGTTRLWELLAPVEAVRDLSVVLDRLGEDPGGPGAQAHLARSRMYAAVASFAAAIADAEAALALAEDPATRGRARFALALVVSFVDVDAADGLFAAARVDAQTAGDRHAEVEILVGWAIAWLGFRGDMPRGWAIADEATPLVEALGDRILRATHEAQLAIADGLQGAYERSLQRIGAAEGILGELAAAGGTDATQVARSLNVGSPIAFARVLTQLGTLGPDAPLDRLPREVALAEESGMPGLTVFVGPLLGVWEHVRGDTVAALARFDAAAAQARALGAVTWAGLCSVLGAECARQQGDTAGASSRLSAVETVGFEHVGIFVAVRAATTRAAVALDAGELGEAERLTHEAVARAEPHHYLWELVVAVELLARIAAANESWVEAARLGGAAARLRREHGFSLDFEGAAGALDEALARAASGAGRDTYDRAFDEGLGLDLRATLAFAGRARGARGRPRFGWESLTPTELTVVEQVEAGLGNAEIARTLLMSVATVKTHLNHVFAKLGVTSRTDLAARAIRRRAGLD